MKTFKRIFNQHFSAIVALIALLAVGLACNQKSDADWKKELGGKKLSRAKNSGSISDNTNIWFCPTGEYVKQTQFSGFSAGGGGTLSMADEDFEQGAWRVEAGTLILQSQEGKTTRYDLSQGFDDNVIELNGNGHLVERHHECR